jgi:hypothetical protein
MRSPVFSSDLALSSLGFEPDSSLGESFEESLGDSSFFDGSSGFESSFVEGASEAACFARSAAPERSSPSSARIAIVVPTGMPFVPSSD